MSLFVLMAHALYGIMTIKLFYSELLEFSLGIDSVRQHLPTVCSALIFIYHQKYNCNSSVKMIRIIYFVFITEITRHNLSWLSFSPSLNLI